VSEAARSNSARASAPELLQHRRGARDAAYILGDAFSAADIYLFMLSRWTHNVPKKARDLPHLGELLARVMARPSVREMFEIEGIGEPYY